MIYQGTQKFTRVWARGVATPLVTINTVLAITVKISCTLSGSLPREVLVVVNIAGITIKLKGVTMIYRTKV